jgi:signal transduction histidine kinase
VCCTPERLVRGRCLGHTPPNGDATYTFREGFYMNQPSCTASAATVPVPRVRSSKPRILCVDDEPAILAGLEMHLRSRFEVITACGGLEALQHLWEFGADSFAAVIADMRMPGMDGSTLLSHVRAMSPDTTRVMLTGYSEMRSAIAAINEGNVFRFLIKPCEPSVVAQTMVDAVDHHRLLTQDREFMASKLQTLTGRLRSAERMAALGTLASTLAEELDGLAGTLDGIVRAALDPKTPMPVEAYVTLVHVHNELSAKVRSLRSVEFPGSTAIEAVDLSEVAVSALDVLRGAGLTRGVRVDIRVAKTAARVMVARAHLERLVIILLNNAIDASESDTEAARCVSLCVSVDPIDGRVALVVEDNGSGVPTDRLESLFRRGSEAPVQGNNANHRLSTVRQLIEAHGGRVWISSVLSGGTTVGFDLPPAKPVALRSRPPAPLAAKPAR